MPYGEHERALARQEFLETIVSGMGGPACAPMPGTFLEMLEIAALERRRGLESEAGRPVGDEAPLTSPRNDSRMTGLGPRLARAAVDVASRFRTGAVARRVPV